VGGFEADSGLAGRKIVIDSYGPNVAVGGGSFSGKDPTKVDRSAAYMARKIAVDLLKKYKAKEVLVKLAYVIGKKEPVMAAAIIDGKEMPVPRNYDLTPQGIIKFLKLNRPIYAKTAVWGHFGRGFLWDK
jgi:S-adenosylmethionine synthetase